MIVSQGFYPIRERSRLVAKFKEKIEQVMISEAFMHYPQDFVSILLFILLLLIHSFLINLFCSRPFLQILVKRLRLLIS